MGKLLSQITDTDRQRLKEIYFELKNMTISVYSLAKLEALLKESLVIASREMNKATELQNSLNQTLIVQLTAAKKTPDRDKNKLRAIEQVRLFLMGDLLGWF